MALLSAREVDTIAARYPEVFAGSTRRQVVGWTVALGTVCYLIFAWWFFSVGTVVANGRWDIAGAYLADWVSYEVRPRIEYEDGYLDISFSRGDPLGENADPDWLVKERAKVQSRVTVPNTSSGSGGGTSSSVGSFLGTVDGAPAPTGNDASTVPSQEAETVLREETVRATASIGLGNSIDVTPEVVTVTRGSETLVADIVRDESVIARGALPSWAKQRNPGDKILVSFGFAGRADIENDEVKISHRFWGWENFLFDTASPFWGKSAGQVWDLITSGERIDPSRSNLSLAWNNILYNAEWQHLDVWTKLLQTIVMAFVGTVLASALAFPLAFLAARNITRSRFLNQLLKRFFDFQRSVDMLIWALFFTRAFGPGPLAGMSAIFFTDTGTLGEALFRDAGKHRRQAARRCEIGRRIPGDSATLRRHAAGAADLPQPVAVFLGIQHPLSDHHRRGRRRRYRPETLGSDANQLRLGECRLYGAAHPDGCVRLRQHLERLAQTAGKLTTWRAGLGRRTDRVWWVLFERYSRRCRK